MNIDVIGTMYNNDGVYSEEGEVITPATQMEGWHVNTTEKMYSMDEYLVNPSIPRRVFSGVQTYFYTFPDEQFWLSLGDESEDGWELKQEYLPLPEPKPNKPAPESSTGVPLYITKRQGRQQLILMGLLDAVESAIEQIPDEMQKALVRSFWDDSTQYERYHPQMLMLAQVVGISTEQLDAAFIEASKL